MAFTKARWFFPLASLLFLADCGTKQWAEGAGVEHVPREVIGDALRLTLVYNPGAAFSVHLGDYSRVIFSVLALVVIAMLVRMYHDAAPHDRAMGASLGLIVGGAVGNLADRLRSARGVVDFIDVGIGNARFWIFNVADVGVTVGALILLYLMLTRPPHTSTTDPT
jgi:signal peptidase II